MQEQETLFVFVTGQGRVMARLATGEVVDVTDFCDLIPRCAVKAKDEREHAPAHALAA